MAQVGLATSGGASEGKQLLLRRGLLLVVAASLVTGILAGLARVGVLAGWGRAYAYEHGPLTVLGAFGTVIALERAVALGNAWGLAAPVLGAAGAVAMLAELAGGAWAAAASAFALCLLNLAIVRRQAALFTWLMWLGSVVLAAGTLLWVLGKPVFQVVLTWIGFFVLTIVAERLELSRLAPTPKWAHRALLVLGALLALTSFAPPLESAAPVRAFGVVLLGIGVWQLRFDLAGRLLRRPGLPRFAAMGVLAGAIWLCISGALLSILGLAPAGPAYDAVLHGVFVGYALSMVFAHAPIILPAVARLDVPFTSLLYVPLTLLHLGLASRVLGDLVGRSELRQLGSVGSSIALVVFAATVVLARQTVARRPGGGRGGTPGPRHRNGEAGQSHRPGDGRSGTGSVYEAPGKGASKGGPLGP